MKLKKLIALFSVVIMLFVSGCGFFVDEELITTSTSPDKTYTVEVYKVNGGATTDYSIRAYIVNDGRKDLIYDKYHDYEADIKWVDNSTIIINEIKLDLSKGETYDWRNE